MRNQIIKVIQNVSQKTNKILTKSTQKFFHNQFNMVHLPMQYNIVFGYISITEDTRLIICRMHSARGFRITINQQRKDQKTKGNLCKTIFKD